MLSVPKLLKQYNEAEEKLHEYFGFSPYRRAIPLEDKTESYWFLDTYKVVYSDEPFTKELIERQHYFEAEICPSIVKCLLRKDAYTMVIVETDFNAFLMIFDNSKELQDKQLINAYYRNLCREERKTKVPNALYMAIGFHPTINAYLYYSISTHEDGARQMFKEQHPGVKLDRVVNFTREKEQEGD